MLKTQRLVGVLRALLALAFGALVVAQVRVLPATFDDAVRDAPELADASWLLVAGVLVLLCVQVVIVCTWRLLTMVKDDRIFSDASLVWVNTIVGAMAAGWVLVLAASVHLVAVGGASALSVATLLLLLVAGAVLGLLMVVMRALLKQATSLRTDLEAVI